MLGQYLTHVITVAGSVSRLCMPSAQCARAHHVEDPGIKCSHHEDAMLSLKHLPVARNIWLRQT
eukprot:3725594-Amphidinium_carterae.1